MRRSGATIGRRAEQLALGGLAGVIIVAIAGFAIERTRLGSTDQEAVARVESDVRAAFARMAGALEQMARPLAGRPDLLLDAAAGNHEAARALFNDASAIITRYADGDLAITVYAADGTPIAWSGRPSELPRDRLAGPQSLFIAPGPLGLRLVRLQPVTAAPGAGGRHIGAVATEALLSARRGVGGAVADRFTFDTSLAPVLLRPRYEGAEQSAGRDTFLVRSPSGDPLLEAQVSVAELARVRQQWRRTVAGAALAVVALTLLLMAAPLLTLRNRARTTGVYAAAAAGVAVIVLAARALLWSAVPSHWSATSLFSPSTFAAGMLGPLLRSPIDLLVTALALLALVALAGDALERLRLAGRRRRHAVRPGADLARFAVTQLGVGAAVVLLTLGYELFLGDTFTNAGLDILHFSLHPLDVARQAVVLGLLLFHAAVLWVSALILRAGLHGWRLPRPPSVVRLLAAAFWATPVAIASVFVVIRGWPVPLVPWLFAVVVVGLAARFGSRGRAGYQHASQAARLLLIFLALLVPGAVMYPSLVYYAQQAKQRVIEQQFAPQVMNQREELQDRLDAAMAEIDRIASLPDLVEATPPSPGAPMPTDSAFLIWSQTDLAAYRVSSAVELYGPDGSLVSRFALNLPEYTSTAQKWKEAKCEWDVFGEGSPFGSEERELLHAGRGICRGTTTVGAIVIHVILDYNTLPFISSQSPYFELLRSSRAYPREGTPVPDVDFLVYGWSRRPIYTSGAVWPLTERTFARIYASREPFWARITAGGTSYEVYFLNDRAGIYALGYPVISPMGHLINLAELVALAAVAYVLMLAGAAAFRLLTGHRPGAGRALLREIRASFYRKLFLAFVAASVVPVLTLAFVARAYIANRLLADVRSTATRTSAVAQRVIEDYATLQQRGATTVSRLDDDVMVWISRVIGQDVNIFERVRLLATSERDLFASGLLPTRTPADVYRAIVLQRLPSFIGEEQAGDFRYLLAAAPVRFGAREAILTVPLTLRQHEIEREIDDLNRRIVLAAVLFILIGAGIGYPMAERIADPVNRLTRATRRIARGDFDARIAATSSDELRRLVEAFNSMAAELARQRDQLERTHRLEAWAEMARQVAHEIKNPLTPIQLSAEHLQRVSHDRGEPLSPVLDECIESILSQVRLLRQIAGEFSSFASSPTPRPTPTFVGDLLEEVVKPYRTALGGRIIFSVEIDPALPPLLVDRTLLGRALTNMIDNSLHAMPGAGTLSVAATFHEQPARQVRIRVRDTGVGMDADALSRLFEPYFSTKAVGTGLGLTIAKRNVELNGGSIAIESETGKGTTVTIVLPVDGAAPSGETS